MKKILTIAVFIVSSSIQSVALNDATVGTLGFFATQKAGVLDKTWAGTGTKIYNFDYSYFVDGRYVVVASDGSVFVAGKLVGSETLGFILKFDKSGTIVSSFGDSGKIISLIPSNSGFVSLALDESTNTLYALGDNLTNTYVKAYNTTTGTATGFESITISSPIAGGLAIDSTGLYVFTSLGTTTTLRKLNLSTGAADATFINVTTPSSYGHPSGLALRNGFVYIAVSNGSSETMVKKANATTGEVEWTSTTNAYPSTVVKNALAVDSQGIVYLSVNDTLSSSGIRKFTATGGASSVLVNTGASGFLYFIVKSIAVDAYDGILCFGFVDGEYQSKVLRLVPGGASIDTSFGVNGSTLLGELTGDLFQGTVAASSGKIYAVGSRYGFELPVARLMGNSLSSNVSDLILFNKKSGNARGLTGLSL